MSYNINLANKAQVDALQAQYPTGRRLAPNTASTLYSAPYQLHDAPFSAPSLRSQWFGNSTKYPTNVETFELCSGGWFGICFLFGDRTNYIWVGKYVYAAPPTPEVNGTPVPTAALAQRRWAMGWELASGGETGNTTGAPDRAISREASRHADGYGLAIRAGSAVVLRIARNTFGAPASPESWERIYIRRRNAPSTTSFFWQCHCSAADSEGAFLGIDVTGALSLHNLDAVPPTRLFTGPVLTLDVWYKIDLVFSYATSGFSGAGATIRLYLNGALLTTQFFVLGSGMGRTGNHTASSVGGMIFGAVGTLEIDLDDWENMAWPSLNAGGNPTGLDWLNGTKLMAVRGTGFNAAMNVADWTGDYRSTLQNPVENAEGTLVSTVSASSIILDTDAIRSVTGQPGAIGLAALVVGLWSAQVGANDGLLGWQIDGGVIDLTSIDQSAAARWNAVMYRPAGVVTPPPVNSIVLRYVKAATVNSVTVRALLGVATIIGTFGPEDVTSEAVGDPTVQPGRMGTHNGPYPTTIWAKRGVAPQSPLVVVGGLYAGNATGQDLPFRAPVNWYWSRRVTAATSPPNHWWSSQLGSHTGQEEAVEASVIPQALVDPSFLGGGDDNTAEQRILLRVTGANSRVNETGVSYQYIAVSDPGMRFMLNGAFRHAITVAAAQNLLLNSAFLPVGGFFCPETPTTTAGSRLFYKGPGHLTDFASLLDLAQQADVAVYTGAGDVESQVQLHVSDSNTPYSLWRLADGNAAAAVMVQILSYVGDGTGARTIALTPVSNRRPLFGLVVPHNGASYQRDPSHTTTTSSLVSTGVINAATAIVGGGIDQIMVESVLNANGIVYDVFVIPGGTAACHNGWGCNGEFFPGEPDSPVDGPWDGPPGDDPDPPPPTADDPICPTPVTPAP